jgi:pimeloyl-ACP methyl ester carboxylesterase
LNLRDGRILAWHDWGVPDGTPLLRLQGTPGSRLWHDARLELWERLGLRVIMADRPGFGASTRLPGRGVADVADDLVQLLDHLGLKRVPVMAVSGGGPHLLALCARHPERVGKALIVAGAAPLTDAELPLLVGLNAEGYRRLRAGGWKGLYALVGLQREAILADPLAAFRAAMTGAPEADRRIMADPIWQRAFVDAVREALRPGAKGWTDEVVAIDLEWDFAPEDVMTPVVWWHARHDANVPLQAVERVVRRMPRVELKLWERAGHLESYHREPELLAHLLETG